MSDDLADYEKFRALFDSLDANDDGTVSRAEFIKALRRGTSGVNELFGRSTTVRQEEHANYLKASQDFKVSAGNALYT